MPTVPVHINPSLASTSPDTPPKAPSYSTTPSMQKALPQLLHTPYGLAIIEIQGTLNLPVETPHSTTPSLPSTPFKPAHPLSKKYGPIAVATADPDAMDTDIPSSSPPQSSPLRQASKSLDSSNSSIEDPALAAKGSETADIRIGRLVFAPEAADAGPGEELGPAARKVQFYVGQRQRLVGEIKKLHRPFAVLQKRQRDLLDDADTEELDVVDVVRYKLYFGGRPEFV